MSRPMKIKGFQFLYFLNDCVVKKGYPKIRVAPLKTLKQNVQHPYYSFNKLTWLGLEALFFVEP